MLRLATPIVTGLALAAAGAWPRPQEVPPADGRAVSAAVALTAESRAELERLRAVLEDEGRESARELLRDMLEALAEPPPGQEATHVATLLELDGLAQELGSLDELRRVREQLLALRTRLLPPDHRELLAAQSNLALTRRALGDLAGAHELLEAVHEAWTRLLPPDHPDLLGAEVNLAITRRELGDLQGAHELFAAVLAARERLLPPDDLLLLDAQLNLGVTRYALGDLAGAHELFEAVLASRERRLPPDHPDLLDARQNVAATRYALGDLAGARELFEAVHAERARLLAPDHPELLAAQQNLGVIRYALGDLAGAHELYEAVHAAYQRRLPPDHPDLLAAMVNLGITRKALGDLAGARELEEAVLAAWTRLLPPDHPDLLAAEQNLAGTRYELGDFQGAHELFLAVHAARERLLPPDHPDLLASKLGLAGTQRGLGDLEGAHELFEAVHAALERLLPPDHPLLLGAKQSLAAARYELGDLAGAHELVASLLAGMRQRAGTLRSDAVRPAREGAREELRRLAQELSLCLYLEDGLEPELFATLEALRLASVGSTEAARALADHPELEEPARETAALRAQLNDLAAAGPAEGAAASWRQELLAAVEERDRSERGLRQELAHAGAFVGEIEASAIGPRLAGDAAAASFLRYPKSFEMDAATGEAPPSVDSLLAFVVRPDGSVDRIELGPAAELEALVQAWRAALGRPLSARGIGVIAAASGAPGLEDLGRRLRERVLDPVLAAAGEAHTLHVVLDDVLHLVPLDALPLGDGIVGERIAIHGETTLARLLAPRQEASSAGGLLAVGGIDYDAEVGPGALAKLDASPPPLGGMRSGPGAPGATGLEPLPGARAEAESISAIFKAAFEQEASVLAGAAATKARLHALAPEARYLHLATHGWFASESFQSELDPLADEASRGAFERARETLTGFAPETLCGLALAGANRGADARGRVPGILTAEELASFDLGGCELAVLSACETNVGLRRAGQGIQSLQSALHAAGARTAITSLWKVDDAATRRLFELFYTGLWKERLGKREALWEAKMALRAAGHPPRDWAAWVLSGDPD